MNGKARQALIWSVGLLLTGVMLFLGLWQMHVFRNQGQNAMRARMTGTPVLLTDVAKPSSQPGDAYGRPVYVSGTYLPQQQLIIHDFQGDGTRVLTALQLADGSIVPVVRGVSRAGVQPPAPPAGVVEQHGLFLPTEEEPEREFPAGELGSVRLPRVAQVWHQPMPAGFLSLNEADAGAQGMSAAVVKVPTGAGQARNSGYALQWWVFAAAAVALTIKVSYDARHNDGKMGRGSAKKSDAEPKSAETTAAAHDGAREGN